MIEPGEITVVNHEGTGGEVAFVVDANRISHYSDVVQYIVKTEVYRCKAEGYTPTPEQIAFLEKEIIRLAVIRRDVEAAQKIRISKSRNLFG